MTVVRNSILIVDDEPAQRQFLRAVLEKEYAVTSAADAEEACRLLENRGFDLVITDQRMPGLSGLDLLTWVRGHSPETPVLLLTAFGSIDSAVEAIKQGAEDYLTKPVESPEELRLKVRKTLEKRGLRDREAVYRSESEERFEPDIVAVSPAMKQVLQLAEQVAPQPTTVLLTGESGTGKEVVARYIHRRSPRADAPFVAVNCAALTETLLESELFGHEKGAFTGAVQTQRGRFELANGGTLFLDEIGETSLRLQAKLLRVIQEQQFERVGGTRTLLVDVRVIAATNKDLPEAIQEGNFREDLFYRLNVFPIGLPSLRDRRDDIVPLARHFLNRISARMGTHAKNFSPEAERRFHAYDWPGNVRELQNAIERALIVSREETIGLTDLPFTSPAETVDEKPTSLADVERRTILETLERNQGDRKATAEQLGISLRTLQYRLKEYGLTGSK